LSHINQHKNINCYLSKQSRSAYFAGLFCFAPHFIISLKKEITLVNKGERELHSLQIGSFVLNGQLILFLSCGAAGWLVLHYRLGNIRERSLFLSLLSNAFWLWLIVWKFSFAIFHPFEVIAQPVALIYFDGGERGIWMACLVAAVYIWHRSSRQRLSIKMWIDLGIWFTFASWLVYHLFLLAIGEEPQWYHAANAGWSAVFLAFLLVSQKRLDTSMVFIYAIWFFIGNVLLLFMVPERPIWILSFSKQQVMFIIIAACLAGWRWFDEKTKKGGAHG
jgi:hypothetical protein